MNREDGKNIGIVPVIGTPPNASGKPQDSRASKYFFELSFELHCQNSFLIYAIVFTQFHSMHIFSVFSVKTVSEIVMSEQHNANVCISPWETTVANMENYESRPQYGMLCHSLGGAVTFVCCILSLLPWI